VGFGNLSYWNLELIWDLKIGIWKLFGMTIDAAATYVGQAPRCGALLGVRFVGWKIVCEFRDLRLCAGRDSTGQEQWPCCLAEVP